MEASLGIAKIVDHKTDERGRVFYKVQWEATWEPAESLIGCQKVIDEFWSSLTDAGLQSSSESKRKRMKHEEVDSRLFPDVHQASESKRHVDELIARATSTAVLFGGTSGNTESKDWGDASDQASSKLPANQSLNVVSAMSVSSQGLQYIENFDNPYVKIILVCKICNKEQSLKFSSNWKQHYLTHASDDEKPHKCSLCSKAFVRHDGLVKHMKRHASDTFKKEEL